MPISTKSGVGGVAEVDRRAMLIQFKVEVAYSTEKGIYGIMQ